MGGGGGSGHDEVDGDGDGDGAGMYTRRRTRYYQRTSTAHTPQHSQPVYQHSRPSFNIEWLNWPDAFLVIATMLFFAFTTEKGEFFLPVPFAFMIGTHMASIGTPYSPVSKLALLVDGIALYMQIATNHSATTNDAQTVVIGKFVLIALFFFTDVMRLGIILSVTPCCSSRSQTSGEDNRVC